MAPIPWTITAKCNEGIFLLLSKKGDLITIFRQARIQIECAFGRLKARWRILNRVIDVETNFAPTVIYPHVLFYIIFVK